ncbi:MAG: pseudouridine synthase [Planctomycetota bacterium]|nr:pseudouridine synthase [Planctomycetota bacterium]
MSTGRRHALERALSKAGLCSRTQARDLVREGRVHLNGRVARDPEEPCDPERDEVRVDGRRLRENERVYVMLHKPRAYLTTREDPEGRHTVYELLANLDAWVVPVGRLDGDTSGLLLFTNDTGFADLVTNPASHVEKTYVVTTRPRLDAEALARLAAGVELEDGLTRPARVEKLGDRGRSTRFSITITEGRNRQVRRMVRAVGAKVDKLHRHRIGPLEIGDLPLGAWRALTTAEVTALRAAARSAKA